MSLNNFIVGLLFLLLSVTATAQDLHVEIDGIKESRGTIRVALYNDEKLFRKTTFRTAKAAAVKGSVKVMFEGLPPGTYAVSVMHDADDNNELNTNLLGIPNEGFGFSNDAMGTFGPPAFEKAMFKVPTEPIHIHLKYL